MLGNRLCFAFIIIVALLVRTYFADTKVVYSFTLDGEFSSHNETGVLKNFGTPEEEYVVTGSTSITYSIPGNDAEIYTYTRTFTADKNGYTMNSKLRRESDIGPRIGEKPLKSSVSG